MNSEERTIQRAGDIAYWGLTVREQLHFYDRLADYYVALSARFAVEVERLQRRVHRMWVVTLILPAMVPLSVLIMWLVERVMAR